MKHKSQLIALGVCGGIAAYKTAELCGLLCKNGYEVQVLMTENATRFVGELTFRTLSRRAVITSLWDAPDWKPEHVALSDEATLLVVAPATANFIAKYANGIADDALTTFAATFNGPVLLAPAMNPKMWQHPACQANIAALAGRGVGLIGPESGRVACGADGIGRMSEPSEIFKKVSKQLLSNR
ncbi:MAG: phosphopantothenoylcysteine decarboxylase [Victivallales bacterium]|jgi:phosphopantothenoylcysteine synthetase/decarboxylase|nr:phosphopantothenoylcysteine decarboxylase [Victivallales bacterium]